MQNTSVIWIAIVTFLLDMVDSPAQPFPQHCTVNFHPELIAYLFISCTSPQVWLPIPAPINAYNYTPNIYSMF